MFAMFMVVTLMVVAIPVLADEGEWEKSTFSSWSDYNIYAGKNELSNIATKLDKANLAYMLVEAFDLKMIGEPIRIKDISEKDWYYNYVQIIVSHNIMELDDGYFYPTEFLLREQIPYILRFLPIELEEYTDSQYLDIEEITPKYAKYVKGFVASDYMSNLSSNYIFPGRIATISDVIVILDKMFPNVSSGITKGSIYNGNFILKEKMTYLENTTINGDLIITQGAMEDSFVKGNFKISLVNVKVNGNIYVYGGNLYGGFFFTNVKANNLSIITESPVIFNITDSKIDSIKNNSKLANFYTNMNLNIVENTGEIKIN
jgi:hypothetical protein